jgi:hypothetical protein
MKREIYKNHPELEYAHDTKKTLIVLVAAAQEAWHNNDQEMLSRLALKIPKRVAAIIKAEGWYTKY